EPFPGDDVSKDNFSRREFIEMGAVVAGASLVGGNVQPEGLMKKKVAPSDRIRFGIVGVGMQGSGLLDTAIKIPGVECAGAADLYDGRHTLAREITNNPSLF